MQFSLFVGKGSWDGIPVEWDCISCDCIVVVVIIIIIIERVVFKSWWSELWRRVVMCYDTNVSEDHAPPLSGRRDWALDMDIEN
jgi:hypothetical protein